MAQSSTKIAQVFSVAGAMAAGMSATSGRVLALLRGCRRAPDSRSRARGHITVDPHMAAAHRQAVRSLEEGGFPVGSVIVKDGQQIGAGFNRHAQTGDPTTHAELEAIRDAAARAGEGQLLDLLAGATCYTTMMPCEMCSGAIIRFGLAAVVVAEVSSYIPADTGSFLEERGVRVEIRDEEACKATVERYYVEHPQARGASRPSDRRWPRRLPGGSSTCA